MVGEKGFYAMKVDVKILERMGIEIQGIMHGMPETMQSAVESGFFTVDAEENVVTTENDAVFDIARIYGEHTFRVKYRGHDIVLTIFMHDPENARQCRKGLDEKAAYLAVPGRALFDGNSMRPFAIFLFQKQIFPRIRLKKIGQTPVYEYFGQDLYDNIHGISYFEASCLAN
ncbi:MAG: hypothetical protein CSYNP_02828 [Syntrophus sp. SKADARSKE-3]|nr:hypothetical protein [Syntrophus sp. SKADARSKE-3]